METLRIALAQINPTVGDLKGNSEKIIEYIEKARANNADIVMFPELAVTGYPPEDLLLDKNFLKDTMSHLNDIIAHTTDIVAIVGFADSMDKKLYNAAGIVANGKLINTYRKINLTRSSVFDDSKYFERGSNYPLYNLDGIEFYPVFLNDLKHLDNTGILKSDASPSIILCMDASCYYTGKPVETERAVSNIASRNKKYIAHLNMTGGQDEWVFEGGGFVADTTGKIIAKSPVFEEDLLVVDMLFASGERRAESGERRAAGLSSLGGGFSLRERKGQGSEISSQNRIILRTLNSELFRAPLFPRGKWYLCWNPLKRSTGHLSWEQGIT